MGREWGGMVESHQTRVQSLVPPRPCCGILFEQFASLSLRLLVCQARSNGFHSFIVFIWHQAMW